MRPMRVEVPLLLAGGAIIAAWWWTFQARELVDGVVRRVCREMSLQRLDETVALERIGLTREYGPLAVRRLYTFEFSLSGADRRRGRVCLINAIPRWIQLDHPDGAIHMELTSTSHLH